MALKTGTLTISFIKNEQCLTYASETKITGHNGHVKQMEASINGNYQKENI